MEWLLDHLNTGFDEAWPYISKAVDKPKKKERARVQVGMDSDVPMGLRGSPTGSSLDEDSDFDDADEMPEWDFANSRTTQVKDKEWEKKLEAKGLGARIWGSP